MHINDLYIAYNKTEIILYSYFPGFPLSEDHPYAKVVRDDSEDPETDTDNYDDPKAIAKDKK